MDIGELRQYKIVMINTNDPFVAPSRVPQTDVLSDRDRTAKSEPSTLDAPDKTTPHSEGDSDFAIEIGKTRSKGRPIPSRKTNDQADLRRNTPSKKDKPGAEGAGKTLGEGDTDGDKKAEQELDIAKLLIPKKIENLELPQPVLPPVGPGKDAGRGNNVEGKDPQSIAQESGAAAVRGANRAGEPDLRLTRNSSSSLRSPGNSTIEARGFQPGDDYVREVSQRIQKHLVYSGDLGRLKGRRPMTISFHIERDGRISNVRPMNRSGDSQFDLMALNAVWNSAPFPPLPKWFPKDYALVEYTPLP